MQYTHFLRNYDKSLYRSFLGLIRTATLKTCKGELKPPIQRLHQLEVHHNQVDRESEQIQLSQTPNVNVLPETLEKNSEEVDLLPRDQGGRILNIEHGQVESPAQQ